MFFLDRPPISFMRFVGYLYEVRGGGQITYGVFRPEKKRVSVSDSGHGRSQSRCFFWGTHHGDVALERHVPRPANMESPIAPALQDSGLQGIFFGAP